MVSRDLVKNVLSRMLCSCRLFARCTVQQYNGSIIHVAVKTKVRYVTELWLCTCRKRAEKVTKSCTLNYLWVHIVYWYYHTGLISSERMFLCDCLLYCICMCKVRVFVCVYIFVLLCFSMGLAVWNKETDWLIDWLITSSTMVANLATCWLQTVCDCVQQPP